MHIKSEKITEARGRAGEIYSSSATRRGDVAAKAIRMAAAFETLVEISEKITSDCKRGFNDSRLAGTPSHRRKRRKLALDNLWLASHRRGTGLAVITKVNNALPTSNGVTSVRE